MSRYVLLSVLVLTALVAATRTTKSTEGGRSSRHAGITQGLDCSACHTPASWRVLEGGKVGAGFDHSRTGFPLTGRHRNAPCTECHQGGSRQIARACASCHEDAHSGRLGQACDRCHSAASWNRSNAFERHRFTRLPLSGMHALADCTECHQKTTDRAFRNIPADCYSCHADDFRRPDVHPLHTGVPGDPTRPPLPRNCTECHRATGWRPALIDPSTFGSTASALRQAASPLEHEAKFPIRTGKHRGADCASCHVVPQSTRVVRCDGCHTHDPARVKKQHKTPVSPSPYGCLACHPGGAAR